ncbi:DUF4352 domain-containing protein [Carnobacterium inhibens]|uniref:DUF4352 domain-containing protein n=1 Tax=Carnobacterium inhibens TaxID=147709 RepID=UPI0005541C86|nr:DUF4352 domain-containing protein [Carnobacterium inhibens]
MAKRKLFDEHGNEVKGRIKKPFYKKVWFWVVAVILIAIIGGSLGGEETVSDTTETKDATETKDSTPAKEESTFKVGDLVTVGDMEYTVNGMEVSKSVGPSIMPTEAKGTFLIVDVTVKNNGNEAKMVDSSFFKLKEGDKSFEADATGSMSANQGEDGQITNSFFLENLNPDIEMQGKIAFDISEEQANSTKTQLEVSTGAFGTETETINLH